MSNHFSVLQSVGDLSLLIDSCDANGVAAIGGTQYLINPVCDWLIIHDIVCSVTANFAVKICVKIIQYWPLFL